MPTKKHYQEIDLFLGPVKPGRRKKPDTVYDVAYLTKRQYAEGPELYRAFKVTIKRFSGAFTACDVIALSPVFPLHSNAVGGCMWALLEAKEIYATGRAIKKYGRGWIEYSNRKPQL